MPYPNRFSYCVLVLSLTPIGLAFKHAFRAAALLLCWAAVTKALWASDIESFKRFLESPPPIEDLVFSEKLPPNPGQARPLDGSFQQSTFLNYYHARWQTNGLLFRQIRSVTDATNFSAMKLFAANFDNEYWLCYNSTNITRTEWVPGTTAKTNRIFGSFVFRTRILREPLLLGIMHLDLGKVVWDGDSFTARSSVEPYSIEGTLRSANGRADSLSITYRSAGRDYRWVARYRYDRSLEIPYFPSLISMNWVNEDGREIQLAEYEVFKLREAPQPLSRDAFEPAPFIQSNGWRPLVFTNESLFVFGPSGQLIELEKRPYRGPQTIKGFIREPLIYPIWAAANISIFILVWRMERGQPKSK